MIGNGQPPDAELAASQDANSNGAQNSFQILKTYFKEHYVFTLSIAAGILFVIGLALEFEWSIPTLIIIIALFLTFMCTIILILGRDNQTPDFFRAASSAVLFLSLLLLLLWLLVNLVWPARHNLYHVEDDLFDRDLPGTLVIRYPDTILADAKPAAFSFVWQPSTSLTTPLTITLNSLSSALQTDISLPHTLFTYTVTPTVAAPLTSHLSIRNGRTVSGDNLFQRLQEETMVLEVSPFTPTQTKPLSETLTIRVETEWGYTIRTFVNNAVTDRSPLLLAVTGLLAVAGFMYQEHLKANAAREERERTEKERREERERNDRKEQAIEEKEEREKREERERNDRKEQAIKEKEEREEQRNRCEESIKSEIKNFKQQLKGQKSDLLSHSWAELDSRVQSCNLQSFNLSEDLRKDLEIVSTLWRIVQVDGALLSLIQSAKDWQDECVAAYLLAYKKHSIEKQSELIQVRQYLPKDKDGVSQDLLNALQYIRKEERENYLPPRQWVSDFFKPLKSQADSSPFLEGVFKEQSPDTTADSSEVRNPFAWEYAEQDIYDLFKSGGFWSGHKVVSGLKASVQPIIICGVPGSGRTTLALDLARYNLPNSQLALYLAQEPSLEDIQAGFGQLLLAFIKDHPIFLGRLRTHERKALISLLTISLSQVFVAAELDAAYRKIEKARNFSEHTDDQQKNEVGGRIALSYLEQFSQEIASGSWPANLFPAVWASLLWRSAELLGFSDQRPRLVLDAGSGSANWWNSIIAPHVWAWHRNGVNVVLTIPTSERDQLQHTSQFDILTIDWDQISLMDMISHRAEKLLPNRLTIADLFQNEALNWLIEASKDESDSYTPRRWIQLWNRTIQLASFDQKIITRDLVKEVLTG